MNEQNKINGLLTQKPDSPVPHVGEARRYTITPRISKTGKEWNKVKAEGEGYGKLYEVVTVAKTDFVDSHGNISFNIDLIELSGGDVNRNPDPGEESEPVSSVKGRAAQASPPAQPSVHSTSIPLGGSELDIIEYQEGVLARCVEAVVRVLDSRLEALIGEASPDARLETVRTLASTLFIRVNK